MSNSNISYSPLENPSSPESGASISSKDSTKATKFRWWQALWQRIPRNWHASAVAFSVLSCCILIVNVSVVVWASRKAKGPDSQFLVDDCEKIKQTNRWIHLGINILSTSLLAAGNFGMQCLCAPTRDEVDKAHLQRNWADIGVQSVWNLKLVKLWKAVLWCLLATSSVPLHLVYNSMFYLSRSNNNYGIYLVGRDFLRNDWDCTDARDSGGLPEMGYTPCKIRQDYLSNPSLFENLTNAECLNIYNQDIISDFSSVIVIADFEKTCNHDNDTLPTLPCTPGVYKWGTAGIRNITGGETARLPWMCSDDPDCSQDYIDRWIKDPDTWRIEYMKITGCVSKKSHCSINFSPQLGIVVIAVNVIKAASLVLVVLLLEDQPLITIGDAIASFMRSPDPTTTNQCLTTAPDVQKTWTRTPTPYTAFHPHPRPYNPLRPRYFRALSPRLWTTWATAFTLYLSAAAACLVASSRHLGSPTALPFSAPLTAANILGNHGFAASVLLANAPQTLLAALYLLTNACLTRMLLAAELASYATTTARDATASRRKGLRVSSPARETAQRGTYFLNLPLRVGAPFAGAMAGLHFLASQSVALAVVYQVDAAGAREREGDYASCSYSPLAMLCVVVGGAAVMGAVAALALGGRLAPGVPAVGSCSVAVAACCHPPEGGADERGKVAWGAVPGRWEEGVLEEGGGEVVEGKVVGHCSFSSAEVEAPVAGRLYA